MRMKLLGLALLAASLPCMARSPQTAGPTEAPESAQASACYRHARLLDPEVPDDERGEHLSRLHTAAEESAAAQHLLGTLFRMGLDHPAQLLARDDAQARHWLGKAALGGELFAMAALAEMDLAAGKPMDAMVWSQLMLHYVRKFPLQGSTKAPEYAVDLVFRSYQGLADRDPQAKRRRQSQETLKAVSKALDEEILANTNAFLARDGITIDAAFRAKALAKEEPRERNPVCPSLHDNERWPLEVVRTAPGAHVVYVSTAPGMSRSGYGFFHVTVAPDGRITRVLMVNALPNVKYGKGLQATVEGLRFNAIEGAPERTALIPMSYSTGRVKVRY